MSRLPVGSSARIIAGLVTSARAIATRCCWPPDSSEGRWCDAVGQSPPGAAPPARARRRSAAMHAGVGERQLDVGQRARAGDQVEALEHEPDLAVAHVGQVVLVDAARRRGHSAGRCPLVGVSRQPRMFISVVLPLPDAPMIATYSPRSIRRLTPRSACTAMSPTLYVLCTSSRSITGEPDRRERGPLDRPRRASRCEPARVAAGPLARATAGRSRRAAGISRRRRRRAETAAGPPNPPPPNRRRHRERSPAERPAAMPDAVESSSATAAWSSPRPAGRRAAR